MKLKTGIGPFKPSGQKDWDYSYNPRARLEEKIIVCEQKSDLHRNSNNTPSIALSYLLKPITNYVSIFPQKL